MPNSEDVHRADTRCICDVVVVVGVDANPIMVPCNILGGAVQTVDSAGHVALVSFWWSMELQWNQDGWWPL